MSFNFMKPLSCSLLIASACAMPAYAEGSGDAFIDALAGGKVNFDARMRYESVDDESLLKDAEALTIRTRLGYTTGELAGFSAVVEMADIRVVGGVDSYAPEKAGYAVIADPEDTVLNRGYIQYKGIEGLTLAGGRQRIIYDNARFIGNVGWRQNEQTFDSFTTVYTVGDVTLNYAFIDEVKGITESFDADVTNHLVNASWAMSPALKITGYGYFLEDDKTQAENDTVGLRLSGSPAIGDNLKLLYTLEYAEQDTNNNDAEYFLAEAGVGVGPVTIKAGYEQLGSDDGLYGFQTPLATKHAFNGWSDKFLATPVTGLEDTYLDISATAFGMNFKAVYHQFDANKGNADYGSETNLLISKAFGKHYVLGVKYAAYNAEDFSVDTDKLWVWGEVKF